MSLSSVLLDPNVVYILLVAALWAIVTAILIPGTGISELIALAGVIGSLILLSQLPANWISIVLIVLGVLMFLVLPLFDYRFLVLGLIGLALHTVGALTMFSGLQVSMLIIASSLIFSLAYYRFALLPTLETQRSKPQMLEDQPLIGVEARVQTAIDPVGTVYTAGESWTARRGDGIHEPIAAGSYVVVSDRDGLTLFVEPAKEKHEPKNRE